jgi:integrase
LKSLFDSYDREVSRQKGASKQGHDARCAEMFCRFLGRDRDPRTLSRRDWDRFIAARRRGLVTPAGVNHVDKRVRDRVIAYDLRYLLAILNWATLAGDSQGSVLLERNPLRGLPLPREESPHRPVIVAEQYSKLRKAAQAKGLEVEVLLVMCHETGHRIGAVRQLRWSDVTLRPDGGTVRWRAELDKIGHSHETPLSTDAAALLARLQATRRAIGDTPVFPMAVGRTQYYTRHVVRKLWDGLAKAAGLPTGQRCGWHALRRKFATELKEIPLKDLCYLGGWKSPATILACYQAPDEVTQRTALAKRKTLHAVGLTG